MMNQLMDQNKSKSKNKKTQIILLVVGGLILVCLMIGVGIFFNPSQGIQQAVAIDPEQVASLAHQITDYNLPTGYSEKTGTSIARVITVLIEDKSEMQSIWLQQTTRTSVISPDTWLRQSITLTKYQGARWQALGSRLVTIRGESTTLTIYEGTGLEGGKYKAWVCAFKGKGGPAMLAIVAPQETWDESAMQKFVDSMH